MNLFHYFYLISALAGACLATIKQVHMFQLNAYKYVFHFDWIKSNLSDLLAGTLVALASFVSCFFGNPGIIVGILLNIVFSLMHLPKKAKKPLVYTARVIRMLITASAIFAILAVLSVIFILTETSIFVCELYLAFSYLMIMLVNLLNTPEEKAVRRYYINDAKKKIKNLPNLTVIGITGSYGKTSTKYTLAKLLSAKYNVLMTPASYNTTMGIVKVIRENLTAAHDIFICEMGARSCGEIKEICDIVKPKHGIITSIGPCHLETFGSIENIIKTKFELCDALPDDGIIFLNADNEYIANKKVDKKAVYYGIENKDISHFTAENITVSENGTAFDAAGGSCSFALSSKLLGEHNVLNIIGCVACAVTLGVTPEQLAVAAKRLESVPHRLSLAKGPGFVIIDDAFNSNPSGSRAALKVLSGFDGCKILITPGMIELGEKQDELNYKLGGYAASVCDIIYLIGERQTTSIKKGVLDAGFDNANLEVFSRVEDAIIKAKSYPSGKRNIILIENDLPDNF